MTAALAVEVTSETTARVSGSGTADVELAAEDENALFHAIEDFAKTEAADSGESVEVSVSRFGATTRLTVTPEGHVAVSAPPPDPVAVPAPTVDEPVTVRATAVNPPRPLAPAQDQRSDTHTFTTPTPGSARRHRYWQPHRSLRVRTSPPG
ncbi:hypothetical protein GCM10020255_008490 [Rhodococcus baikonurensis]